MTDWEGRIRHMEGAIARDRLRVFGRVDDEEYALAWARRLLDLSFAPARDEYHQRLESARRAASALLAAAPGENAADDRADRQNFDDFLAALPDVESAEFLGPDRALEHLNWRVNRLRGLPETPEEAARAERKTAKRSGCLAVALIAMTIVMAWPVIRHAKRGTDQDVRV
jgi:hypothetical protein